MTKILVLGAGMVGSVIAADLAADRGTKVTVADCSRGALARARERARGRITCVEADGSDARSVRTLAEKADFVVGALPGRLGFRCLESVIQAGRSGVDISFMPEDFLELAPLARRRGVTVVADCGVAPGMSNMLAAWGAARLTRPSRLLIMVGGLPRERRWPFEYKAPFSPADVIEEYVRPARVVRGGRVVVREALSEPELVAMPGVGTVESFLTDGLRSLAHTLRIPEMEERTLRYPGHIHLMRVFRELGLFSETPVDVGGVPVVPLHLTSKLLFPRWTYQPDEHDLTVMRVEVEGLLRRKPTRLAWDLHDVQDPATGFSSMARTTGFPAAAVLRLVRRRRIRRRGVLAPEHVATEPGVLDAVLRDLAARGVRFEARVEQLAA